MDLSQTSVREARHGYVYPVVPFIAGQPSFEEIYHDHFDYVWMNLRRLGVSELELDDAVQDVFLVLHRRADEFEGRSTLKTWLYGIARRVAFRYRRSAERARRRSEALGRVDREGADLDTDLQTRQAWSMLYKFLDTLDDEKREAFVIGEFEGLNRRELGRALGVNPNTAYSRLRAARERFQRTFASEARRRGLLRADRARHPEACERRRVWAVLVPQLGAPVAYPEGSAHESVSSLTPSGTGGSGGGFALFLKVAAVAFAVAGGTALAVQGTLPHTFDPTADPDGRGGPHGISVGVAPVAGSEPSVPMVVVGPARRPVAVLGGQVSADTGSSLLRSSVMAPMVEANRVSAGSSTRQRRSRRRAPIGADGGSNARSTAAHGTPVSRLAAEVTLIRSARASLARKRPSQALADLRRHAREHRNGELAVVRRALRIDALCRLHRIPQARSEARAFLAEHRGSSEAAHVMRSCGGSGSK
ncbi:MAG: sigma-70 family RNA polymerase sigma factor [Nannocystaceae bacterium]